MARIGYIIYHILLVGAVIFYGTGLCPKEHPEDCVQGSFHPRQVHTHDGPECTFAESSHQNCCSEHHEHSHNPFHMHPSTLLWLDRERTSDFVKKMETSFLGSLTIGNVSTEFSVSFSSNLPSFYRRSDSAVLLNPAEFGLPLLI